MLQKPNNYDSVTTHTEIPKLPVGGYVLRILGTKQETGQYGDTLVIRFDITEGTYAGFFSDNFEAQKTAQFKDIKWKGTYRISLDDSEEWKVRKLKTFLKCVEESNAGFQYDWNAEEEPQLKGKYFGGIFNSREWEKDGKTGWYTQFKYPATVEAIRSGEFKIPADEPLKKEEPAGDAPTGFTALQDSDIPF